MSAKRKLYIDIESYWDKDVGFQAGQCIWEYILNPGFYCTSIISAIDNGPVIVRVFKPPVDVGGWAVHQQEVRDYCISIGYDTADVVCVHNGAFDFPSLGYITGLVPRMMYCSLLGDIYMRGQSERVTNAERTFNSSVGLEAVYQYWMGNGMDKYEDKDRSALLDTEGKHPAHIDKKLLQDFVLYGKGDVDKLRRICDGQIAKVPPIRRYAINWAMRQMTEPRLMFDADKAEELFSEATGQMKKELADLGITEEQLRSAEKFHTLMKQYYEPAGLPWPVDQGKPNKKTGESKPKPLFSKADPRWKDILASGQTPETVKKIMDIRGQVTAASRDKRIARYCNISRLLNGFLPVHVLPSGAHTHRLTGGSGSGGNPLNLPSGGAVRNCIKAPPGWTFFVGDYSGIELRIARWMANVNLAMQMILAGEDLYIATAAAAMNKDPSDITDDERKIGKITELSAQFGVGARRLSASTGRTEDVAQQFINTFRKVRYPELPVAWNACEMILNSWVQGIPPTPEILSVLNLPRQTEFTAEGNVVWPSGVSMTYPSMQYHDQEKTYCPRGTQKHKIYGPLFFENLVQGLANEVMWDAQYRVERETGLDVCFQVYDELIVLLPLDGFEQQRAEQIRQVMTTPLGWWPEGPPLGIDYTIANVYGDAK